jgi:adenylate cyclase
MRLRNKLLVAAAVPTLLLSTQIVIVNHFIRELQSAVTFISAGHVVIEADFRASEFVGALRRDIKRLPTIYSGDAAQRSGAEAVDQSIRAELSKLTSLINTISGAKAVQQIKPGLLDTVVRAAGQARQQSEQAAAAAASDSTNLNDLFEQVIASDHALGDLGEALNALAVELRKELQVAVDREGKIHNRPIFAGIIIGGVSVLLLLAFAWLYVDRHLAAQLIALSRSMRDIARGNLRVPLPVSGARDEIGDMIDALTVFRDTAVEVEEKNLREVARAQRRLVDAIESISEGFALWGQDDRLVMYNSRSQTLLGLGELFAVGTRFEDLIRELVLTREHYDSSVGDGQTWLERRLALHRKVPSEHEQLLVDGTWLRVSEYPTQEAGTVTVWTDITTLKRREAELERAMEQADAANSAKSAFLANMSHELRTPLNAIIGVTEMLQEDALDLKRADEIEPLDRVMNAARHLLALINDILDLSKIEAGRMELRLESFSIAPLIKDVVKTIETLAVKNANRILVDCSSRIGSMHADQIRVRQALLNLVSNANKFTERGTITITVHAEREAAGDSAWITIAVVDTGIGMAAEQMEKLFQDFSQVDTSTTRKYGGTGLGLAISRRFCQMMGGDISVESELGRGSTFTIRLPAKVEPGDSTSIVPNQTSPPRAAAKLGKAPLIVVADDDPTVREVVRRYLEREGYSVATAEGGREGLRLVRELRPAAMTLDVLMPDLDGWTVLAAIKGDPTLADIPVILLTILDEQNRGYSLGAADYLTKPVDRDKLARVLRRICGSVGGRLLVVDDDDIGRNRMRTELQQDGWDVAEAENGRIALACLGEVRPDAIILDLMMPEMDGFEFLEQIHHRPEWCDIPVVVVTSKDLTAEDRSRLNIGVERIIQKTDRDETLRELRGALDRVVELRRNGLTAEA